jgi:hypothetical protein
MLNRGYCMDGKLETVQAIFRSRTVFVRSNVVVERGRGEEAGL